MKRISVFISEPQHEQFRALAESRDQPASELIRQALNEFLARHAGDSERGVKKKTARKRAVTRKRA